MKRIKEVLLIILTVLLLIPFMASSAGAVNVIRNGDFSSGLAEWVVNPEIDPTWNSVSDGVVSLNPPTDNRGGFMGTIIHQNLNVTDIADKQFTFSMDMLKNNSYSGNTIEVVLTYIDSNGNVHGVDLVNPADADISDTPESPSVVTAVYIFPADAVKLIKVEIEKCNDGDFTVDNISLTTTASVGIGQIPVVTGLSAYAGAYDTSVTITGNNFGTNTEFVSIGGSFEGVTVTSWSDTSITATISDPARSGRVYVNADYVESNITAESFTVTSPNYTVNFKDDDLTVVKGQTAEYVIRADFHNKFTTSEGITFSIVPDTLPSGAMATFTPQVPLKNAGGVLLKINTGTVTPGYYLILLKAEAPNTQPRYVPFLMEVVTIQTIRFYRQIYDPQTETTIKEDITQINLTAQGSFNSDDLQIDAIDSLDNTWDPMAASGSPIAVSSSNPSVVLVEPTTWGPNYYALAAGSANIVATATDGTQASLPVNVTIGANDLKITDIFVSPAEVHPNYTGDISFSATGNYSLTQVGFSSSGMVDFRSTFFNNTIYTDGNKSVASTFQLGNNDGAQEPGIFMVTFSATTSDGSTNVSSYAPLQITADPNMGQIKGGVCTLDDMFAEEFLLEFYDAGGTRVHERDIFLHHQKDFHLTGIPTGNYRLKLVHEDYLDTQTVQWYPNADNMADAQLLSFTTDETVENVYFFLSQGAQRLFHRPGGIY